ncbi:MAG: pyridoxal phosphate-dependent decarboxylase family protein [Rhodoluna sp.]
MHQVNDDSAKLRAAILEYAKQRLEYDPPPLDAPQPESWLATNAGKTVTEDGVGGIRALEIFAEVLAPATISTDHPNYLSFIPTAPTEASKLFDLVVSASAIYGGSWMEGAGAVHAENEVLHWLAGEVGLPKGAGGVFVQGGTLGNLSALVAARHNEIAKRKTQGKPMPNRWKFICSSEAHSSLTAAAHVMDVEIVKANADDSGHLSGDAVSAALRDAGDGVFAIVATAGTTNFGIIDRLDEIGEVANQAGIWFHIDGAYGLAGILDPKTKEKFIGANRADSFIVDPHKWLFAPFDACALVYRNPQLALAAHSQHGEYLETLNHSGDWNPSDYAYNLTRRPRGLPLWFSLATHGIKAYRDGVATNIELASRIAKEISTRPELTLVRSPELSVVVWERNGWSADDYERWSKKMLASGFAFVVPSSHKGKPNLRFAIVNPKTKYEDLIHILDTLKEDK